VTDDFLKKVSSLKGSSALKDLRTRFSPVVLKSYLCDSQSPLQTLTPNQQSEIKSTAETLLDKNLADLCKVVHAN